MKLGVLLLNLGGPRSLEEVEPFLYELFLDSDILPFPRWLKSCAAFGISKLRRRRSQRYYRFIGGGSPLLQITRSQANALEHKLKDTVHDTKVYVGMRYLRPSIQDVWTEITKDQRTHVVVLPLYPQFSQATTQSSFNELERVIWFNQKNKGTPHEGISVLKVKHWYSHRLYIEALAAKIKQAIHSLPKEFKNNFHLIFSAHSLPMKNIRKGDPYEFEIHETVRLVMERLSLNDIDSYLTYQSKAGLMRWLGPSTQAMLNALSGHHKDKAPKKAIVMIPISFVSDHVETLFEIDIYYRNMSEKLGFPYFVRSESLNTDPMFISSLTDIVLDQLAIPGQRGIPR